MRITHTHTHTQVDRKGKETTKKNKWKTYRKVSPNGTSFNEKERKVNVWMEWYEAKPVSIV